MRAGRSRRWARTSTDLVEAGAVDRDVLDAPLVAELDGADADELHVAGRRAGLLAGTPGPRPRGRSRPRRSSRPAAPTRRARLLWTSSTPPAVLGDHQRQRQRDARVEVGQLGLRRTRQKSSSRFSLSFSASGGPLAGRHLHLVPARPDRGHQHPARVEVGVARPRRRSARMIRDLEPRLREPLGDALAPLHDRHRVVERGVEVEVVELVDAAEPVGVDVHQRRARRPATGARGRSRTSAR